MFQFKVVLIKKIIIIELAQYIQTELVHLPLLEMARTVKVSKEKAKKERAREAGDKKVAAMKKLREENREGRIDKRKER